MKKMICLLLALMMLLCGCQGNFGKMDLHEAIALDESGAVSRKTIQQIQNDNAIGTFTGSSNGYTYEWTIFGSDILEVRDVNLQVTVEKVAQDAVAIRLAQTAGFGFRALLSVTLPEAWMAQSATAYQAQTPVASVSLTGSKTTVLNFTLDGTESYLVIQADPLLEDAVLDTQPAETEPIQETIGSSNPQNNYLSGSQETDNKFYTDGKDKYLTDPVPEGKPNPVEPENQQVDKGKTLTCTFSIECSTILNNLDMLDPNKREMVPSGGVILAKTTVTFYEGESVYDVLQRLCKEKGIHMEASWTPIYNSAYVEGIHNLYEFDCGALSGWMYRVNGWYPNYGCSRYQLQDGDLVEWRYTCDLGYDVGGAYAVGG